MIVNYPALLSLQKKGRNITRQWHVQQIWLLLTVKLSCIGLGKDLKKYLIKKQKIDGKIKELVVHRKGSTRAFPPNHDELPSSYKKIGQPVIIGGSMETGSYLLVGTEKAMQETFGTTAHGSGRTMSRTQA